MSENNLYENKVESQQSYKEEEEEEEGPVSQVDGQEAEEIAKNEEVGQLIM